MPVRTRAVKSNKPKRRAVKPGAGRIRSGAARNPKLNAGTRAARAGSAWDEIYAIVKRVPRGRIANYGQISGMLDRSLSAQMVGWAMRACPEGLPWHRVVNAVGGCSTEGLGASPPGLQRAMLEAEGIEFGLDGTLDMERYRWKPRLKRRAP